MQLRKPLFNVCLKSENETQSWCWNMWICGVIVPAVFWMVSPLSFLVLEFYSGPSICKLLWSFREIFCTPAAHSMFLCTFLKDRETGAALEVQDHHIPPGNSLTSECIIIPTLLKALDLSRKLPAGWVSEWVGNRVDMIDSPLLSRPPAAVRKTRRDLCLHSLLLC